MRHKSCKKLISFVYRLNMRTYSSLERGGYVIELYAIEDVMLPIHHIPIQHVYFFGGIFTFAKVEC